MLLLALLAPPSHAADAEAPKFPVIKPSGVLFAHYTYDLTDGADGYNEFGVDRVYLRTDVKINKRFATRVTLDADRMKPLELADGSSNILDTKYRLFVKHAYLAVKDLGPLEVRAGMIDTPYTSFYDNFWGNRYLTEAFSKNAGVLETADLGVALLGTHAGGLVDWNVSVVNGEGYSKVELDAGKAVQARFTLDPLASQKKRNLPITLFGSMSGHPTTTKEPTYVAGAAAGFQMPKLLVWAEALSEMEGGVVGFGYSATLNPRHDKYAGLVVRYDRWDPDMGAADDAETFLLAAIEKDFTDKIAVSVGYERAWADAAPDAPEHVLALRMQAGF